MGLKKAKTKIGAYVKDLSMVSYSISTSKTIKVLVELRGEALNETGVAELTVELPEGSGLIELLKQLEVRLGWPFTMRFIDESADSLREGVIVLVNRAPVRRNWKNIKFKDGASVILFPHTVCGG